MRSYTVEFTVQARVSYTGAQHDNMRARASRAGASQITVIAQDARRMINQRRATDDKWGTLIGTMAPSQGSKVRAD